MESLSDEAIKMGRSHFRGHPIIFVNNKWLYEDNKKPIPGYGGDNRPCKKCGDKNWSGTGHLDQCLGLLPGVTNACCGHGVREKSYIQFKNGIMITGFIVRDK